MKKNIEVSESVYNQLADLAIGFDDTPNSVIERLIAASEQKNKKPDLLFLPEDEKRFKKLLLRDKKAEVALFKEDGSIEILVWQATKIHENSNLRANIWSGHLRNWKEKKVIKAEFSIYAKPVDHFKDKDFFEKCEVLSPIINVPYRILTEYEFEYRIAGGIGVKDLIVEFSDGQDLALLENSQYFDAQTKTIVVPQSATSYPFD
ncbi:hypothetical protein ACOI22_09635 [Glaciecola sp. 2405UD65-10]|uniref:hypothetical protein n=1 Tax=Glaciecola sp. 2405UD65-10 TaxID=3397244 RepID=UPI003B5AAF77